MTAAPTSSAPSPGGTVATVGTPAAAGRWRIDAAASALQISVKVGFVATVTGRFTRMCGLVHLGGGATDSRIDASVETGSLTSGSSSWDTVLINAGLVDTTANPTVSFCSTALRAVGDHWTLDGDLRTRRGVLPVRLELRCLGQSPERIRFEAVGSIASRDAVRLLSQPGVERLIGRSMALHLRVEAVPAE